MSKLLSSLTAPKGANKRRKRVGCGSASGHGGTSTRVHKGAKSRSGAKRRIGFEGGQMPLIRRVPKRGFNSPANKIKYQIVNLYALSKVNVKGEITPRELKANGLIRSESQPVKILGSGELKKAVTIKAEAFSKSAEDKITKIGGKIQILS